MSQMAAAYQWFAIAMLMWIQADVVGNVHPQPVGHSMYTWLGAMCFAMAAFRMYVPQEWLAHRETIKQMILFLRSLIDVADKVNRDEEWKHKRRQELYALEASLDALDGAPFRKLLSSLTTFALCMAVVYGIANAMAVLFRWIGVASHIEIVMVTVATNVIAFILGRHSGKEKSGELAATE